MDDEIKEIFVSIKSWQIAKTILYIIDKNIVCLMPIHRIFLVL